MIYQQTITRTLFITSKEVIYIQFPGHHHQWRFDFLLLCTRVKVNNIRSKTQNRTLLKNERALLEVHLKEWHTTKTLLVQIPSDSNPIFHNTDY